MSLSAGTRLGPYEILAPIGAGGMGEVYRARDTRLDGTVADGKRVLITIRDPATKTRDIWIRDLARGTSSRLTFDPAEGHNPAWSPDGAFVVFSSSRKGKKDIYRKRADGVGGEEELLATDVDKGVDSISPDGKYVLYADATNKDYGQFSPNGRWIAYTSVESGLNQLFVQNAPGSGLHSGKWQVSSTGGAMPQWRRDGKELYYLAGRKLMAAPVKIDGTSFESGAPVALFDIRPGVSLRNHFTVTADGQRFLFAWPHESKDAGQLHVILNWPALLKKP